MKSKCQKRTRCPRRWMDENNDGEEGLRDEPSMRPRWKCGRRKEMVVVEMSTVSGATPLNFRRGFAADCFTTDSVVSERTGTMPRKNDFYCFAVPVPLIIERIFVNCPRDAARLSGCKASVWTWWRWKDISEEERGEGRYRIETDISLARRECRMAPNTLMNRRGNDTQKKVIFFRDNKDENEDRTL